MFECLVEFAKVFSEFISMPFVSNSAILIFDLLPFAFDELGIAVLLKSLHLGNIIILIKHQLITLLDFRSQHRNLVGQLIQFCENTNFRCTIQCAATLNRSRVTTLLHCADHGGKHVRRIDDGG